MSHACLRVCVCVFAVTITTPGRSELCSLSSRIWGTAARAPVHPVLFWVWKKKNRKKEPPTPPVPQMGARAHAFRRNAVHARLNAITSGDRARTHAHNPVILPDLQKRGLFHLDLAGVRWTNGRQREGGDDSFHYLHTGPLTRHDATH